MLPSTLIRRTPAVRFGPGKIAGVAAKLENLQRTGSFKLRGVMAKMNSLSDAQRARGVVSSSAGNHGAGLALAARELGIRAVVVIPRATPENKRERIRGLGAEVIVDGDFYDDAQVIAKQLAADRGLEFVSPYDDDDIIAGNGMMLGRELHDQLPDLKTVICPVGGGGLIGGLAAALSPLGVRVLGAQPENNCAMHDSMKLGRALTEYRGKPTLAEGCEGAVAQRTYELCAKFVERILLVSEAEIRAAVAMCYHRLGNIVECSAAVAVAAACANLELAAPSTAVIVTGGNIDPDLLSELIAEYPANTPRP